MIHHTSRRKLREEDQLAAMVVRELRERLDLSVTAIHTEVGQECYELVGRGRDDPYYAPRRSKRGRLKGYLRNVAINKVLLTNQRWPFVLKTPLNADIVIGMDVKHNTCLLYTSPSPRDRTRSRMPSSACKKKQKKNKKKHNNNKHTY